MGGSAPARVRSSREIDPPFNIDSLPNLEGLRRRLGRQRLVPVQSEHHPCHEWDRSDLSVLRNVRASPFLCLPQDLDPATVPETIA
jgi:hypothetical protein